MNSLQENDFNLTMFHTLQLYVSCSIKIHNLSFPIGKLAKLECERGM